MDASNPQAVQVSILESITSMNGMGRRVRVNVMKITAATIMNLDTFIQIVINEYAMNVDIF